MKITRLSRQTRFWLDWGAPCPSIRRHFIRSYFRFLQALQTYIYIYSIVCCVCWFFFSLFFLLYFAHFQLLCYFLHILKVLFCCILDTCKDTIFILCQILPILPLFSWNIMFHKMLNYRLSINLYIFQHFFTFWFSTI